MPEGDAVAIEQPQEARGRLEEELAAFERFADRELLGGGRVDRLERYAFVLSPSGERGAAIDLLFMALTHGNEYGGLPALNTICGYLDRGVVTTSLAVGFLLCNVEAARRGLRFIERDLNRSFGRATTDTIEDRRAREIEPFIGRARYCVDLHQTIEPTDTPFFVVDYHEASLRYACAISPELPIVTYWGRPFSATTGGGCTSSEYLRGTGGVGLGIELGQKGFARHQVAEGIRVCLDAIAAADSLERGAALPPLTEDSRIYTWRAVVPYPPGEVVLDKGLKNFQPIARNQRLGTHDGAPLLATQSGLLFFPKYRYSETEPRPAELYRLLRRPALSELGRGDCLAPS